MKIRTEKQIEDKEEEFKILSEATRVNSIADLPPYMFAYQTDRHYMEGERDDLEV